MRKLLIQSLALSFGLFCSGAVLAETDPSVFWADIAVDVQANRPVMSAQKLIDQKDGFQRLAITLTNQGVQPLKIDKITVRIPLAPKHLIRKLYNTLLLDPRHNYLAVVEEGEISKRSFADWTMAFAEALDTGLQKIPGFSNYMNDPESSQFSLSDSRSLWHLLKVYREQMR